MADTETDNNIQICLLLVQILRLQNRIAHMASNFLTFFWYPNSRLIYSPDFTCDSDDFQVMASQYFCKRSALTDQSDAGGDSDFLRPDFPAKAMISSTRVSFR